MSEIHEKDCSLELFIVLARAYNWVNAHVTRDIRRYGLNPTEFGVLDLLYHKGPQPLQQIGEKILISSGNITYVVDKLEKKCLLVRKPCLKDRRVIYAELTEKGKSFFASVFPKHKAVIQQAVSGLDEQEKEVVTDLLKKLGYAAQKSYHSEC
ncbi:MarR family winged helix-turn-helix transcriptional regulator [Thermoflavimicrobium dichotomicum]|uniref:MarR family transcriptional regulator, 2-MHQ and catechol-resistance regulon repressor n=1 Tax=Thermoflavimicrobium dichotomicum TaxID=46223 RepID=A0A1I3RXK8_9BACL|nr:MarR family transcriptional regulator [Thermoflavimicrobium dichotomicum]SFJ51145.1 MarR family transcriptional regulator, 2-MHQ and catechol-resistance regulon repressor [Thermoflavimicrobium dichotomicum]